MGSIYQKLKDCLETVIHLPLGQTLLVFGFLVVCAFLISGYEDLQFALYSKTVDARIDEAHRIKPPVENGIRVRYTFTDEDRGERTEVAFLPATWEVPKETIRIEYIPSGDARIKAQWTRFQVFLIIGVPLILALILWGRVQKAKWEDEQVFAEDPEFE